MQLASEHSVTPSSLSLYLGEINRYSLLKVEEEHADDMSNLLSQVGHH